MSSLHGPKVLYLCMCTYHVAIDSLLCTTDHKAKGLCGVAMRVGGTRDAGASW